MGCLLCLFVRLGNGCGKLWGLFLGLLGLFSCMLWYGRFFEGSEFI